MNEGTYVRMGFTAAMAAIVIMTAGLLLVNATPSGPSFVPQPIYSNTTVYHNSTVVENVTNNYTTNHWSNTTVYVNSTHDYYHNTTVYVNSTYIETVPVVELSNVTLNGQALWALYGLNISTGAVLWVQHTPCPCGSSDSLSVNAPFAALSASCNDGTLTVLVGMPYEPGIYQLAITVSMGSR